MISPFYFKNFLSKINFYIFTKFSAFPKDPEDNGKNQIQPDKPGG